MEFTRSTSRSRLQSTLGLPRAWRPPSLQCSRASRMRMSLSRRSRTSRAKGQEATRGEQRRDASRRDGCHSETLAAQRGPLASVPTAARLTTRVRAQSHPWPFQTGSVGHVARNTWPRIVHRRARTSRGLSGPLRMESLQLSMPALSPDSSPSTTRAFRPFSTARDVRPSLRAVSVAASFSTPTRLHVPKHQVEKVLFMGGIECKWAIRGICRI